MGAGAAVLYQLQSQSDWQSALQTSMTAAAQTLDTTQAALTSVGSSLQTVLTATQGISVGDDAGYAPLGGQYRIQDFDRERYGGAAALQYESANREFLATLQFIRSDTTNAWGEFTFETGPDLSEYNTFPKTGTTYTVDEDLVFESGFITLPGTGWRSASFNGQGNGDGRVPTGGMVKVAAPKRAAPKKAAAKRATAK